MIDRTGNNAWLRGFVERAIHAWKFILRCHRESYGKLGDVRTWLISLAVSAGFLLIAFLITH